MSGLVKNLRRRKGVLLIEALVAVTILSVGVVTVMTSFAVQRRGVSRNAALTRALFALEDAMGARWAALARKDNKDVRTEELPGSISDTGLRMLSLTAAVPGTSTGVVIYVRAENSRRY